MTRACRADQHSAELDAALLPDWHLLDCPAVGPRAIPGWPGRLGVWREDCRIVAVFGYKGPHGQLTRDEEAWWLRWPGMGLVAHTAEECREFSERVRRGETR